MIDSPTITHALFESLRQSPLLCGDFPEAPHFDRAHLESPPPSFQPNFDQKLGHLYEDLAAHILGSSSTTQLAEKNLQIRSDIHHTLGELDFLIRTPEKLIHLELAVKFYLAVKTPESWHLPGPDARDNYPRKLARLRQHQLILTQKFQHHLPEKYRHEKIHPQHLIYGCLFDHIHATQQATAQFIHPHCRRGHWLHQEELTQYAGKTAHIHIIPKPLWPVPLNLLKDIPLEPYPTQQKNDRCIMVKIESHDLPHFIVPQGYPHSQVESQSQKSPSPPPQAPPPTQKPHSSSSPQ